MEHNFRANRVTGSSRTQTILDFDNHIRQKRSGRLCGMDEAGRGPLAGPVVAAAVVFADDVFIEGVFDSKKLTHRKREELFEEIKDYSLSYGVGMVDNNEIDGMNILEATRLAMNKAVSKLKIKPGLILVDGNFYSHKKHEVQNIIRGDSISFSVAAASIIAKVTRDRMMKDFERIYPHYSFSMHKGYGTKKHIEEIRQYGFSEIHRRSFKIKSLSYEPW
jgi:ribonuclease HII